MYKSYVTMQILKLIGYYNVDDSKEFLCVDTQFCKTKLVKVIDGKFVITNNVPFHLLERINTFGEFFIIVTDTEIKSTHENPAVFATISENKLTVNDNFFNTIYHTVKFKLLGYSEGEDALSFYFYKTYETSPYQTDVDIFYDGDTNTQRVSLDPHWMACKNPEIKNAPVKEYNIYSHYPGKEYAHDIREAYSVDIIDVDGKTEVLYSKYENIRGNQFLAINTSLFKNN